MKKSIFAKLYDRRVAIFLGVFLFAFALVVSDAVVAFAAAATGGTTGGTTTTDMPWNTGLTSLIDNLTGRTALLVSMFGLFFAGGILIFGGELGSFTRMVMMIVLVGSILTGAASIVKALLPPQVKA